MICTTCKQDKIETEFNWKYKARGIRQRQCRECTRASKKRYYENNRNKVLTEVADRKADIAGRYRKYKSGLSCVSCGEDTPECIDFHHVIPDQKDFVISEFAQRGYSWERIVTEIEKCIPLCKNCHVKVHLGKIELV